MADQILPEKGKGLETELARLKAFLGNQEREMDFYKGFRHDLSNYLQVINSLSQLGQEERCLQALRALMDKLKIMDNIKEMLPPDLLPSLGGFIFSLPAGASLSISWDESWQQQGSPFSAGVLQALDHLKEALKPMRPEEVSLAIWKEGQAPHHLEVSASLKAALKPVAWPNSRLLTGMEEPHHHLEAGGKHPEGKYPGGNHRLVWKIPLSEG